MALEALLALGLLTVIVLAAGGGAFLWNQRRVRQQQRQSSWRELCLRLELAPQPGNARVATGQLPETDFLLHDTGADWLVELPLSQPLLPPGMVLLSPEAPSLPPHIKLRPLEWGSASMPPGMGAWSVDEEEPSGQVEAPQAFLEEASRAMQAHAPLRVESRRLIQALRVGTLLSVNEVREAVRALDATARRWLEVAMHSGLPRVQPLAQPQPVVAAPEEARRPKPPQEPAPQPTPPQVAEPAPLPAKQAPRPSPQPPALHRRVLPQPDSWRALLFLNAGIPIALGLIWLGWDWVMALVLLGSAVYVQLGYHRGTYGARDVALWVMMGLTTLVAPWCWGHSYGRGMFLIYIFDAVSHQETWLRQLALLLWGLPNAVWLGWMLKR